MISKYAKKLLRKKAKEQKRIALLMRVQQTNELFLKDRKKISERLKEEREDRREEQKKFIKKENSTKPVGVKRNIIGEKQAENYTPTYYKTEDWKSRSKALIEKAGKKCSKCNSTEGLVLHHLTYGYKPHTEPEEVLECLCKNCHHLKHEINKIINGHVSRNMDKVDSYRIWDVINSKKQSKKRGQVTQKINQLCPSLWRKKYKDYGNKRYRLELIVAKFLNVDKLEKIQSDIKIKKAEKLIVKSYWVSTSGDTKKYKTAFKERFRLTWNGYKKAWQGAFIIEKDLDEFVKYCEENEIKYSTQISEVNRT